MSELKKEHYEVIAYVLSQTNWPTDECDRGVIAKEAKVICIEKLREIHE